jgi:hypothetical protein
LSLVECSFSHLSRHPQHQQFVVTQTRAFLAAKRAFAFAGFPNADTTGMLPPFVLQAESQPARQCMLRASDVGSASCSGGNWSLVLWQIRHFSEAKQKRQQAAAAAERVATEDDAERDAGDEGEGMESEEPVNLSNDGSDFTA